MDKNKPLPTGMAYRYECAWNKLFYSKSDWVQKVIIEEPDGRHAKDLAHEVALLAENNPKPVSTGIK